MKYMLLIIGNQHAEPVTTEADEGLADAFMSYHTAICDAGVVVDSNILGDWRTTTTSVQVSASGEQLVTDGPFAETREFLGGYYVLDLPDLDAAIDWAARCPGAGAGRVEVRPVLEFDVAGGVPAGPGA